MKFKLNQIYTCSNSNRQYKYKGREDEYELFVLIKMGTNEIGSHLINAEYKFITNSIKEINSTTFKLLDKYDKTPSEANR